MSAKSAEKPKAAGKRESPVWLFTGPEAGEKNDQVEALRRGAKKSFGDLEDYKFYAEDIKAADLITLLQNGSLFSSGKFVTVKNAESFRLKDDVARLVEWISSVPETRQEARRCFSFCFLMKFP